MLFGFILNVLHLLLLDRFLLNFLSFSMINKSHSYDNKCITKQGIKYKENTPKNPKNNSRNMVCIFRSAGNNICEDADEYQDRGDEKASSCRVGSGGDAETGPGNDDNNCGGKVIGQEVFPIFSRELYLKTSNRERICLIMVWKFIFYNFF